MVGLNMDGPERDELIELMVRKDSLEALIKEQNAVLATNNIGMQEPLIDKEGYPRADIDVYNVRHARNKIICLQNDHKKIMKEIEQKLGEVHFHFLLPRDGQTVTPMERQIFNNSFASTMNGSAEHKSFAAVGHVYPGSPADAAGLLENDQIIQMGSVNASNFDDIVQLHDLLRHSLDQQVLIRVRRGENIVNAYVTPRIRPEPGLLGCEIIRQYCFTKFTGK